jgi:O-antigen/teichoic acid export membrane protein
MNSGIPMSGNKTIVKNSLLLYLRLFITTAIGLIAIRIVIRNIGIADYGLYSVVGGVVVMMGFLNIVMVTTTYRFIAFEMGRKDNHAINKVFNISLLIHIGMAFMVVVLAETIGVWYINNYLNVEPEQIGNSLFVFRFSVLATIFNILSIPFQGLITALEKFSVRVSIEIIRSILNLLFVTSLIYFTGDKLRLYAVLMALLALVPSSLFIIYCKKKYVSFTQWKIQRDKAKYKEMIVFSGWTMLGAAASIGQTQGSVLIINSFFGTILNASFGIATQLNSFVLIFSQNLGQAAIPQITKNHSGGDKNRVLFLVTYISKYSFFLMLLPALPILLETEYILKLWLGDIPEYTVTFTQLMIIIGLLDSARAGLPAAISASGKIKWFQITGSIIFLASLPISYLMFELGFLPYTIQIVYIGASLLSTIVALILLKRLLNFDIVFLIKTAYKRIIYICILVLPLFYFHALFQESILRLIISTGVSTSWFLFVVYLFGLDTSEKAVIAKNIKLVKNKIRK